MKSNISHIRTRHTLILMGGLSSSILSILLLFLRFFLSRSPSTSELCLRFSRCFFFTTSWPTISHGSRRFTTTCQRSPFNINGFRKTLTWAGFFFFFENYEILFKYTKKYYILAEGPKHIKFLRSRMKLEDDYMIICKYLASKTTFVISIIMK